MTIERALLKNITNPNHYSIYATNEQIQKTILTLSKKEKRFLLDVTVHIHLRPVRRLREAYIKHRIDKILLKG